MSDLEDAREELVSLLNTIPDVRAVSVVPKTFTPPIVWVAAGSPYRQRAQGFANKRINLVAVCLGGASTNDETEALTEELAESVADKIDKDLLFMLNPLAEMDQPRLYPSDKGVQLLGIAVNISRGSTRA